MTAPGHDAALLAAAEAARAGSTACPTGRCGPRRRAREMLAAFSEPLPEEGTDPAAVVRDLAERAEPGLMASGSGRFHGWVIGGALPAAIAADWLVSAWDQNSAMSEPFPATTMIEQVVAGWVLELLDLPREASVGFVTGGQMANTACLAAARNHVLAAHGWDVERGRAAGGAPRERARGRAAARLDRRVPARARPGGVDGAGRRRPTRPAGCGPTPSSRRPRTRSGPTIVCLQAGNVNGGAVDPWARSPTPCGARTSGCTSTGRSGSGRGPPPPTGTSSPGSSGADSWATDAHKWLNTPYDCGMAICAHPAAHRRAMGVRAAYLPEGDDAGLRDPIDYNPELSRRARSVPVWAALRQLGRRGVAELVERCCRMAELFAALLSEADGVEVLHQDLNQVVVRFLDPRAAATTTPTPGPWWRAAQAEGTCYPSGTVWRGVGRRAPVGEQLAHRAGGRRAVGRGPARPPTAR